MTFLRKSGSLVVVWIKSLATAAQCSFCSGNRSHWTNFATPCFVPKSWVKILAMVVFRIPRSTSSHHTVSGRSLLIAPHTCSSFSGVLLVADLSEHGSLSTDSQHLWSVCATFICTVLIASSLTASWIIQIVSVKECSSLTQNLMQIHCTTCSVVFECDGHTVQWCVYCPHE